jgi:hypothetical protein
MRAARAVLASGYEPEAQVYDRILVELAEHRRAIVADPTGVEAKAWLNGARGRGIGSRVTKQTANELYSGLSQEAHGDPRTILERMPRAGRKVNIGPRRTRATRASLLLQAGFAYETAKLLADARGLCMDGADVIEKEIEAAWTQLDAESEPNCQQTDSS